MSTYDYVKVEVPLPGDIRISCDYTPIFQTKSLGRSFDTYVISSGGELYKEITEPNSITREYLTDFEGDVTFSLDGGRIYTAVFRKGRIFKILYTNWSFDGKV